MFSWTYQEEYLLGRRAARTSMLGGGLTVVVQIALVVLGLFGVFGVVGAASVFDLVGSTAALGWVCGGILGVGVAAMALAGLAGLGFLAARATDQSRRVMEEQGAVFIGTVRECSGQWRSVPRGSDVFRARVVWCLRLPDGRLLEEESTFDRNDLGRGEPPMPRPGAPIAILVRAANDFQVL